MLRIDRLATLYFFHPIKRITNFHRVGHIPILMYHSISEDSENGVHPYYQVNTSPDVFAKHMKFLYDNNYTVISLKDAMDLLTGEPVNYSTNKSINPSTIQPINYAVLTFDDGFRDFYTQAFPILYKYRFTATVFLPTSFVDNKDLKHKEKEHLSWEEVRELHNKGIDFGSHTATHPQLKTLKKDEIEYEIRHSRETIEDELRESIDSFSYPFAFPEEDKEFTKFLKDILQKCGYKCGVSTRIGTATKRDAKYYLKRIPINSCDDGSFFKAKLEGAYDWLSKPQYIFKKLKRKIS